MNHHVDIDTDAMRSIGSIADKIIRGVASGSNSYVADFFERYFDRYIEEPMSGCWIWVGSTTAGGYGNLTEGGRSLYAHRVSFEASNGEGSSADTIVRHRCDNPFCINPDHLVGGTHADNYEDARRRGRLNHSKGDEHPRSVMTASDVLRLRNGARAGAFISDLADASGLSWSAVYNAVTGATWAHLPDAVPDAALSKKPTIPPVLRGEQSPAAILSESDVRQIRARLAAGEVGRRIAEDFGVSPVTISAIKVGRIWSHVA